MGVGVIAQEPNLNISLGYISGSERSEFITFLSQVHPNLIVINVMCWCINAKLGMSNSCVILKVRHLRLEIFLTFS